MKKIACFSFLFCLFYQSIFSQKEKIYKTIQVASPIRIDGHIDEQAWGKVTWAGDFIQTEPENGAKPTFDTQFKIIYDQDNLYVAIRAFDPKPDSIVQSVKPRDFFAGDYVEINIDRDVDKKDAFSFTITAAGIRGDEHIKTHTNWYNDWNPNWTAQTAIDSLGWLAEMQIPFKALEIHNKQKYWGIQVNRSLERLDEGSSWTRIPDEDRWVEYFGRLVGIEQVPISRTFSPTEEIPIALLQQDFDNLFQALELAHPSLYRYQSKYTLTRKYEQVLNALEKGQTLIEYYKLVSAFISKIGDGHMNVELPDYFSTAYYDNQQKLPFNLKIHENEAFIVENYTENDLLNGSRITAINGKAIGELIYESGKLISSDGYNATGKHYKLSNDFDFYYALTVGFSEKVSIDFIPKGGDSIHTMDTKLLAQTELEKINPEKEFIRNNEPFDYRVVENVGILTLRTFNHATGFQEFVDESFNKLAESGIDKLVLDVRGNGGGEEVNAIHLYAYLT
ncbi:MAG: sugar-binding protein, partial [Bacteroidota bacterium]